MSLELRKGHRLRQDIRGVVLGLDRMDLDLASVHILTEVMILYVDRLRSGSHLGDGCNFECA